ncbi:MAG TPA: hypothetical protein VK968_08485 [Roseimicrobium sp.]|nr:hypothetical protein [Roseimicrobium sp.]
MSHDPHAQLDQTVLEMIEHSPVGAVPHTPSYQDALKRLRASHQVYVSADHKGGHVTVRSLAALPLFHASNLEALTAGKIAEDALESDTSIFSRYVQSLPASLREKAEASRALVVAKRAHHRKHAGEVVQEPMHTLFLVPGAGPHPGLPGNYLYGSVLQTVSGAWAVHLHDADDGAAMCEAPSQAEALDKLQEVLASAPFLLSELDALGFRSN